MGSKFFFLFAGLFFFVAGNAVARIHIGLRDTDTFPKCAEQDPFTEIRWRPNCSEWVVRAGERSFMSYNSMGLRDKEYSARPKKDWQRILLVGSSNMAAPGLAEPDSPPRRFEFWLRRHEPKVEVINGGVEAFFTVRSAIKLPNQLLRYSPSVVIFNMGFGAPSMSDSMSGLGLIFENGNPARLVPPSHKLPSFFRRPAFWGKEQEEAVNTAMWAGYRWYLSVKCRLLSRDAESQVACLYGTSLKMIDYMKRISEESGARFLLVFSDVDALNTLTVSPGWNLKIATAFDSITPMVFIPSSAFRNYFLTTGIDFVIVPDIQELLPNDQHFNKRGADLYGRYLAEKVMKEKPELLRR